MPVSALGAGVNPRFQWPILDEISIARAGLTHWKANQTPDLMICHHIHL